MTSQPTAQSPLLSVAETSRRWWALLACCVASSARLLVPPPWIYRMPAAEAFNEGWARYNLLMSIVAVGTLAFLLIGGVLGDMFGRRRLLLAGLGGLCAANALMVVSGDAAWFVFTRLLGGAASALIIPLSLSVLYVAFKHDSAARTVAIAIYVCVTTAAGLGAGLLGQLSAGLLGWRGTVLAPTIMALLGWLLVARVVDESSVLMTRGFDVVGHASWSLAALGALVGLTLSRVAGRYALAVVAASLASVLLGIVVLILEDRRGANTLLRRGALPQRALLVLIVYGVCLQLAFAGFVGLVRSVMVDVYGSSAVLAGLALAPLLAGMLLASLLGVPRMVRLRARTVMSAGLLAMGAVVALAALTRAVAWYPWLALLLLVFGAANVAGNTAWTAVFLTLVPKDAIGVRTGINSSVSQIGGVLGAALTGSLLASIGISGYLRQLRATDLERTQIDAALAALNSLLTATSYELPVDAAIRDRLVANYQAAYLDAAEQVLLIVAAIALVGCAVLWLGLPTSQRAAPSVLPDE